MPKQIIIATAFFVICASAPGQAVDHAATQSAPAPTGSLLVETAANDTVVYTEDPHALRQMSLFAIAPQEPREFSEHDLVQIIIRETSTAKSSQELETEKEYNLRGEIKDWPGSSLSDLLELVAYAGRSTALPKLELEAEKEFTGEGDFERKDDLTARLTAEVVQVLPNGNLVIEARTHIKVDKEESTMKVTGICRADDVTPDNTIYSNQIHDLKIEKMHQGELKKAAEKGVIARVFDTIFAF